MIDDAWLRDVEGRGIEDLDNEHVRKLTAEVRRLRAALEKQPGAEGHVAGMFCSAYHGKSCSCGHAEIAKALGRPESPT